MAFVLRIRRYGAALPWRQLVTVLAGVAVIVAMVVIAETARGDEQRHQQVQVLVERVRASSQELGELAWQGLAETSYGGRAHKIDENAYLSRGLGIWSELNGEVGSLRRADRSPMTVALLRDAGHLYSDGLKLLPALNHISNVQLGMREARMAFTPALDALDRDSVAAAAAQQHVAHQAATRAGVAYIGSLLIGLVVLLLLGLQLYRISRRSLLVEERRFSERRSEARVRALVEHSSDIITVVGPDLTVRWQSTAVQRVLGHPVEALLGQRLLSFVHPDDAQRLESHFAAATSKPGTVTFTARFRHASGSWRDLEAIAENRLADPAIEGVVLSMRDISERKALEDELRHQAFHDALTGLANRALFEDRLAHALAGARRHGRPVAVLFLDLDDFKTINDSLGHSCGDELLRAVAIRIAAVVRVTDTAARLGGDEFAVLLEIMDHDSDAESTASRLLERLAPPFQIGDRELRVSASIGIAVSDGAVGVDELLRNADTAMYAAKDAGKGAIETFEEGMHKRVLDRLELTGELQRALDRREFELDYQPIVELEHGHVIGCEALVRWAHPVRGRLLPAHFIALAEETGLIVPLGTWVLNRACAQAAIWQREFPDRGLYMAVNVSTRQLHDLSFPETVANALHDSRVDPALVVLEITESLLPDDSDQIIDQLHNLKALGVRLAVDDFGTGYSALSRLQAYPVDILKIDRSFINGIEHDAGKLELVRGIVNLGESLHMSVVAEGIEEPEQADQIRRMQSPVGQGYLFSRPVASDRLHALLTGQKPLMTGQKPLVEASAADSASQPDAEHIAS
jgi:diguanylate cyclase (GGDEF)-like protein/PAS domain S-box-containing protein